MVAEQVGEAPPEHVADPSSPEPFAFEMQERHLVQGIQRPQAGIEFQAVDDRKWWV